MPPGRVPVPLLSRWLPENQVSSYKSPKAQDWCGHPGSHESKGPPWCSPGPPPRRQAAAGARGLRSPSARAPAHSPRPVAMGTKSLDEAMISHSRLLSGVGRCGGSLLARRLSRPSGLMPNPPGAPGHEQALSIHSCALARAACSRGRPRAHTGAVAGHSRRRAQPM